MYRKEILTYCISICFVLTAALLHLFDALGRIRFSVHIVIFCLYTFVIFLWRRNMENRLLRAASIRCFQSISYLLVVYLALRTLKYEILFGHPLAIRYIRYGYYFCTLHIVHLVFSTSLMIAKSEREPVDQRWRFLWIPTELFVVLILTNELHGLAFSLTAHGVHEYGPIFYAVLAYISLLAAMTLIFTLKPSFETKQWKPILLPVVILVLWILYTFFYIFDWQPFRIVKLMFASTEFNILAVILFIESLVFTRLLPSNRGYQRFVTMSALNIGIIDQDGTMIIRPKEGPTVDRTLVLRALHEPVALDPNTLLESASIRGGQSFWFTDLTDLNALKAQLSALNEDMMSENDLLKANNKLREERAKLEEQEAIRSAIDAKLRPQFQKLGALIEHLPEEESAFERALKDACVYNAYIKRYANLYLLSKTKPVLPLGELRLAFLESMEYLRLRGVKTELNWNRTGELNAQLSLEIYEFFETVVESCFSDLFSIAVCLERERDKWKWTISIRATRRSSLKGKVSQSGDLEIEEHMTDAGIEWQITAKGRE